MEPWHVDDQATIYHGDCLEVLRELPDASVDSVVTDPPYGLEFMGKDWDKFKTGRGAAYSSGGAMSTTDFKNLGTLPQYVSRPAKRCGICGKQAWSGSPCKCPEPQWVMDNSPLHSFQSWAQEWTAECLRVLKPGGHLLAFGGTRTWHRLAVAIEDAGFEIRDSIAWMYGSGFPKSLDVSKAIDKAAGAERSEGARAWTGGARSGGIVRDAAHEVTTTRTIYDAPATPDAARWQGWGTALKPAHEPVVVARKPLTGTVAANVLEHGTGALNIDGCRIGSGTGQSRTYEVSDMRGGNYGQDKEAYADRPKLTVTSVDKGRWPANVVLDEDQAAALDRQSGNFKGQVGMKQTSNNLTFGVGHDRERQTFDHGVTDFGGASRFFYVAKAPARERPKVDGIAHPTVKPLTLMRWLCRLVTPPGGTVLEPFAGSGTTIEAALMEGFRVVAIEREPDYLPLIAARLERVHQEPDDGQLTFDASA